MSTVALPEPVTASTTSSQRPRTPTSDVPTLPAHRQMLAFGLLASDAQVERQTEVHTQPAGRPGEAVAVMMLDGNKFDAVLVNEVIPW